ncbi:fumarylacetoacetate hydrolase family protein [Clostridium tyrobutyricum]|nr:fumarylacetoacetate hydrolase family protein [Clostridium tyrobutyricum]MBV4444362.1 fumarylacetoacetate hydrolase family protein [Clostridium tyrobutyricum]
MIDLIKNLNDNDLKLLKQIYYKSYYCGRGIYDVSDVKICSSIERTESDIICLGLNYKEHVKETAKGFKDSSIDIPEYPVYFSKRAVKTIGPNDFIDSHSDITDELDYEVELAIIIGKYGSDIPKEKA